MLLQKGCVAADRRLDGRLPLTGARLGEVRQLFKHGMVSITTSVDAGHEEYFPPQHRSRAHRTKQKKCTTAEEIDDHAGLTLESPIAEGAGGGPGGRPRAGARRRRGGARGD